MKSKEEYEELIKTLEGKGYRKYAPHKNANESWYKGFLHNENVWEEDRSCYQICWNIYDFSEWIYREPHLKRAPYSFAVYIMVSRRVDERVDLLIPAKSVEDAEKLGASFYEWVKENIEISKR